MASAHCSSDDDSDHVARVVSRRLVKASDTSIAPHVLQVSNLDLIPQNTPLGLLCLYPRPSTGAVAAAFEAGLPGLLNHFFPLAGRIASNPCTGHPEVQCCNQGAELVVAEAGKTLASLVDYGTQTASMDRILPPYGEDVALSVQLVSFACGGFAVAWRTHHVLVDMTSLDLLVRAWSELSRSGTLASGTTRPSHDRSVFRPGMPPSYSAAMNESFTALDDDAQRPPADDVPVVADGGSTIVRRLYYIEARDIERLREAASRDGRRASRVEAVSAYVWKAFAGIVGHGLCRMGWVVDGRQRFTTPRLRAAMRSYVGNVTTLMVQQASVHDILRMPLAEVAAIAHDTIMAPAYDEHFQELVDWVEEHKGRQYAQTASQGIGSPAVIMSAFVSTSPLAFHTITDFGFGHAALVMPLITGRLSSGFVWILARPGGNGSSWIMGASVWPQLAAALDSDENRVFKTLTAEYLGLGHKSRL